MNVSADDLRDLVRRLAAAAEAVGDELNRADAALGDGDLGITITRGLKAATAALDATTPETPAAVLLAVAKAFQATVASSFGTLTATALMAAARSAGDRERLGSDDLPVMFAAMAEGVARRGKATPGDKTVLDTLVALADGLRDRGEEPLQTAVKRIAAKKAEEFTAKPNRIGRARMFGDRSVGLVDPGMLAVRRLAEALA